MTRRLAFVLAAATLLSGCSTFSGPNDLFGYPTPQPGVLAGALVQPLPPAPAAGPASAPASVPAPVQAALPSAAPAASSAAPLAVTADEREREQMVAAALAPASAHQGLSDLPLNAGGTMILPTARSVEIIDIAPIRNSMAAADDLPAGY